MSVFPFLFFSEAKPTFFEQPRLRLPARNYKITVYLVSPRILKIYFVHFLSASPRYPVTSAGNDYNRVRKAIAAGYFNNVCKRDSQEGYRRLTDQQQVFIHPSSALYQKSPEYVVYHELVLTTKEYIREVSTVDAQWLPEVAPNLFQKSDDRKLSKSTQLERIQPLHNKFEEKDSWRLTVRMGQPNL